MEFNNLINNNQILRALTENNIIVPTEIQSKAIPVGIEGKDIIAKSQTGTGKTLAFTLPILESISNERVVQALIVCPTRELSMQVYNEICKYIKYLDDISAVVLYGGSRIDEQIRKLKKRPQIVVATPGRLLDHINRKTVRTSEIKTVVLDEADEMISIGFKEDLEKILSFLPNDRQTLFFSATFPKKVAELSKEYLTNPVKIKQDVVSSTVDVIDQFYIKVNRNNKGEVLKRLVFLNDGLSIVFCNTKKMVDETVAYLQSFGIIAEALHGDLNQMMRENVMNKMRSGILQVLVATDVAARGIDIKNVEYVYNYDFPDDFEYYVHRIGRTGRAGNTGTSFSFVSNREIRKLEMLEKSIKTKIKNIAVPTIDEVNTSRIYNYFNNLNFDDEPNEILDEIVTQGFTYKQIANALLNDKFSSDDFEEITVRVKRKKRGKSSRNDLRLFLSVGKKDGIKVKHIVGSLKKQINVNESNINDIEIKDAYSFVSIPKKHEKDIRKIKAINNIYVRVEKAKSK